MKSFTFLALLLACLLAAMITTVAAQPDEQDAPSPVVDVAVVAASKGPKPCTPVVKRNVVCYVGRGSEVLFACICKDPSKCTFSKRQGHGSQTTSIYKCKP